MISSEDAYRQCGSWSWQLLRRVVTTIADNTLLFGSELRALMQHPSFKRDVDREAIAAELRRHDLTQALFNLPPGDFIKGERDRLTAPEDPEVMAEAVRILEAAEAKFGFSISRSEHLVGGAAIDATGVRSLLGQHVARYKVPKVVRFMDALPKSTVGKILRRELRDAPSSVSA